MSGSQPVKVLRIGNDSRCIPPRYVEYLYYAYVVYGIVGSAWGLTVGMLGGGMLAGLAAFCIMRVGSRATTVYAPIALLLGCTISYVVIQLVVHGESFMDGSVRGFVNWIQVLLIVQALALRQGFLHRFSLVAFLTGLPGLKNLQVAEHIGGYERVGLARGKQEYYLANANGLAGWFGFCAVYFIVVAIETKRTVVRVVSGLLAVGCLYVVGITVSRGALLAVAIATIVALRRLLKRGFLPVLCLAILSLIIYASGVFDQAGAYYAARGLQETGRGLVWPLALERFLNSPLTGVGVSNVPTYVSNRVFTPHNSFLFIALASGIIPLVFFVTYWWRVMQSALRASTKRTGDAPFCLPLVIYAFLQSLMTNQLVEPWLVVTLAVAMTAGTSHHVRHIMVRPMQRDKTAEHIESWGEAGPGMARAPHLFPQ
jgi:O-antigen ligase